MDLILRTNIGIDDIENKIAKYVHEGYQKISIKGFKF